MSLFMWIIIGVVSYFVLGIVWSIIHARYSDFFNDNKWFDDLDMEIKDPFGVILSILFWVFPLLIVLLMCLPTGIVKFIISKPYSYHIRNTWFRFVGWNSFEERKVYKPQTGEKINKKVCRSCLGCEYENCSFVFRGYAVPQYPTSNSQYVVCWDIVSKSGSTSKRCVLPKGCNYYLEHTVMNNKASKSEAKEAEQKA